MKAIPIYFPDRDHLDMSDPEVQAELIRMGVAKGIPGAGIVFTKRVNIFLGDEKDEN